MQSFKKNPFFATWDPLSLELYVECQLWENKETGEVKLKMSGTWVGGRALLVCYLVMSTVLLRKAQCSPDTAECSKPGILCRYSTNASL